MPTIQLRVDSKTKKDAKKVLDDLGLDMSSAIKLYLNQIIIQKGIPFRILTENGMTIEEEMEILQATKEAKEGKNIVGPFEVDEALDYLDKLS